MSCSPTVRNIKNCKDCVQSPSRFWCSSNQQCYCLNNPNKNICFKLLAADYNTNVDMKPCVVSPSVSPPVDCPPSYKDYCDPSTKKCLPNKDNCSPSEKVCYTNCSKSELVCAPGKKSCAPSEKFCPAPKKKCFIPTGPFGTSVAPSTATQRYDQYLKDLQTYQDSLPRQPPPFDNDQKSKDLYKRSPFCYDCEKCADGPYIPPPECTYGNCIRNNNDKYILRCISPTNRQNICSLNKSNYCLGKDNKWINTKNPDDCIQFDNMNTCNNALPFKFTRYGPRLNPGGIYRRVASKYGKIRCPIIGKLSLKWLLFIIIVSIVSGLLLLWLLLYYFF